MAHDVRYLSCAETARLVRQALKNRFPGSKFSVKSDVYAGGASIHVRWRGEPGVTEVDRLIQQFAGSVFDPTLGLRRPRQHWLMPDKTVTLAYDPGTLDCQGIMPSRLGLPPHPEAQLVDIAADFLFCFNKPESPMHFLDTSIELPFES